MQNEEAKWILQMYRPDGQDASEPEFQQALEQARRDPELGRWFAQAVALDTRIGAKLRQATRPPETLKPQLLALASSARPLAQTRPGRVRWSVVLPALAAVLVLGLMLGTLWFRPPPPSGFAGYLKSMTTFVSQELDRLDFQSRELKKVRQWLASRGWDPDLAVPDGLASRPSLGCRLLEWNGHPVALICFALDERRQAHLLAIRRDAFQDAPAGSLVQVQWDRTAAVAWSDRERTYLLVAVDARPDELLPLLQPSGSGSSPAAGAAVPIRPDPVPAHLHASTAPRSEAEADQPALPVPTLSSALPRNTHARMNRFDPLA